MINDLEKFSHSLIRYSIETEKEAGIKDILALIKARGPKEAVQKLLRDLPKDELTAYIAGGVAGGMIPGTSLATLLAYRGAKSLKKGLPLSSSRSMNKAVLEDLTNPVGWHPPLVIKSGEAGNIMIDDLEKFSHRLIRRSIEREKAAAEVGDVAGALAGVGAGGGLGYLGGRGLQGKLAERYLYRALTHPWGLKNVESRVRLLKNLRLPMVGGALGAAALGYGAHQLMQDDD